jgi:uncharacterized membrane-anchored protein YhcB (DUF1043 family)
MTGADTANPFNTYMNMVTAVAVTVGLVMGYFRDKRLATGTAQVATEARKVASAVVDVKTELNTSKEEVATHRLDEKQAFGTLQNKVDATHIIVNAQKTAMMQKLADSQLFTLTLAKMVQQSRPEDIALRDAVSSAQALYDASLRDLEIKQREVQT